MKINIVKVDINQEPVILINGLTMDDIKAKYNWILNARMKNAILGENNKGIVFYQGEWLCGEWYDGTWYSGVFHTGLWNNGEWFSYQFDYDSLLNDELKIVNINNDYSHFLSGVWMNGDFFNGTFGVNNEYWDNQTKYDLNIKTYNGYNLNWNNITGDTIWMNGNFKDGLFINSNWKNGNFYNKNFINSLWNDGVFYGETFDGYRWYNGLMKGGDFIKGIWDYGIVDQLNNNVPARWGSTSLDVNETLCFWNNGIFRNGSFHSGLVLDISGNTTASSNNKMSVWYNGTFENGKWYGGQFQQGSWLNGQWYNGVWGTWSSDWVYPEYAWAQTPSIWNNLNTLTGDTINDYAYTNQTAQTFIVLSGFNFNINQINPIIMKGIQVRVWRSGFYDTEFGNVKDNSVSINIINSVSGTTNMKNITPFSYQNSYSMETIDYGSYENYWGNSGWTLNDLNSKINVFYKVDVNKSIRLSPGFRIDARLHKISVKVFYQTQPTWNNGTWYNGLWINGYFLNGNFKGGMFIDGYIDSSNIY